MAQLTILVNALPDLLANTVQVGFTYVTILSCWDVNVSICFLLDVSYYACNFTSALTGEGCPSKLEKVVLLETFMFFNRYS